MTQGSLKQIEVVAAVIESLKCILCVQRGCSKLKYISEKWEFPGGKIEVKEDHGTALRREILEELQVVISVEARLITIKHEYPDFFLTMHAYHCKLLDSESSIVLTEHKRLLWLDPFSSDFENLDWAAADVPIVNAIRKRN
jgi:8-oxo-dGTP diphosphatase